MEGTIALVEGIEPYMVCTFALYLNHRCFEYRVKSAFGVISKDELCNVLQSIELCC